MSKYGNRIKNHKAIEAIEVNFGAFPDFRDPRAKRKKAGWKDEYLIKVLTA